MGLRKREYMRGPALPSQTLALGVQPPHPRYFLLHNSGTMIPGLCEPSNNPAGDAWGHLCTPTLQPEGLVLQTLGSPRSAGELTRTRRHLLRPPVHTEGLVPGQGQSPGKTG